MKELLLAQMIPGEGPSPFGPMLIMGAIFGIFYLLVMRPQQQKERQKETFRSSLKKNDEVLTAGGIYGRVVEVKGSVVWLELGQNVRVRVERRSIEPPPRSPKAEEKE